jgi:hypothetical protein
MGNTNLPQAGAADTRNGKDTSSGEEQLADRQKGEQAVRHYGSGTNPSPSRPKNAPERIPGQERDPDETGNGNDRGEKRDRNDGTEQPAESNPRNPQKTAGAPDSMAGDGHANTGHSPPDAT